MTDKEMTDKEILSGAIDLLEKGFCHGDYAKTKSGESVRWNDEKAVKFCTYGAIWKAACRDWNIAEISHKITTTLNIGNIVRWNDGHSKKYVVEHLKKVLETL